MIELNFMKAHSYDDLEDSTLRVYLDSKSTERSDNMSVESLDALIKKELKADMSDKSAPSRMENLFIAYNSLLRRHGLSWLTRKNPKMAVRHVLSAIKPDSLRTWLKSDIKLRHLDLKTDLSAFMSNAIDIAHVFEKCDTIPMVHGTRSKSGSPSPSTKIPSASKSSSPTSKGQPPICLYEYYKER